MVVTRTRLQDALAVQCRLSLAQLPTPLEEAPRLSERLGVRVLIKRDDLTGLALGGNKVRKLEFLLADALAAGADTIITAGATQSNHARITAAACCRLGLTCNLVLTHGLHDEPQGNLLLDQLFGATIRVIENQGPEATRAAMEALAKELRAEGWKLCVIPVGGSTPAGATGYAAMVNELLHQLEELDVAATHLYLVAGSGGTQAGIVAGMIATGLPITVQGISVAHGSGQLTATIADLARETLRYLGLEDTVQPNQVHVDDHYVGPAYGVVTPGVLEALEILARDEGVLLDPVYTAKAMAGLIDHARQGKLGADDIVIFLHSGGVPALFAYHQELSATV